MFKKLLLISSSLLIIGCTQVTNEDLKTVTRHTHLADLQIFDICIDNECFIAKEPYPIIDAFTRDLDNTKVYEYEDGAFKRMLVQKPSKYIKDKGVFVSYRYGYRNRIRGGRNNYLDIQERDVSTSYLSANFRKSLAGLSHSKGDYKSKPLPENDRFFRVLLEEPDSVDDADVSYYIVLGSDDVKKGSIDSPIPIESLRVKRRVYKSSDIEFVDASYEELIKL